MDQHTAASEASPERANLADMVASLSQFEGPPGAFLLKLLEVQCTVAEADGAAILGVEPEQAVKVIMMHPAPAGNETAPLWVAHSAQSAAEVLESGETQLMALPAGGMSGGGGGDRNGDGAREHVCLIPLQGGGGSRAVAVYFLVMGEAALVERARERLELTMGLLSLYELRLSAHARHADLDRLRAAMELLDAVNEQGRMKAAAMAFCNEIAVRWDADRVCIGFLDNRYVKTAAISHTEKFDRKMTLVQDIESAMEECLDQDVEISQPPPENASFISRATAELAGRHGPCSVLSLPLRHEGEPVAVLTIERPPDQTLTLEETEALRLTCDLCTARLVDLHEHDKWIGAKAAGAARQGLSILVGPRHTWTKVIVAAVIAFLLFIFLVRGPDRVDASFEITAIEKRLIPAPFPGRLQAVFVEPGDSAFPALTVLARLETAELQLRLAAARAERSTYMKEADRALRDSETVAVQIAEANLQRIAAEVALLEHQIGQADIVAPIEGTVVLGDLKRQIGAPVETGDVLFEIAALGALRANLAIAEDRITDLVDEDGASGPKRGTLASVAHPGDYIPFEIERINPVAEVIESGNVFMVRVRLLETRDWLRPGMKGVAKVDVGRRPYAFLWTRKLVNWVRMKLWI